VSRKAIQPEGIAEAKGAQELKCSSYGKNGQVLAGADDLIQLIGSKVIVGKISQHHPRRYYQ